VVADFSGEQVQDWGGYSFSDAGCAMDTQFLNPNLHPVAAFKFRTPDMPAMTLPSYMF
jgi:hypothetical protein